MGCELPGLSLVAEWCDVLVAEREAALDVKRLERELDAALGREAVVEACLRRELADGMLLVRAQDPVGRRVQIRGEPIEIIGRGIQRSEERRVGKECRSTTSVVS